MKWLELFRKKSQKTGDMPRQEIDLQMSARPKYQVRTKVWSVGGGKGGVGKSLIAANLGILLTRLGNKVLLVDADLGAANLHTLLGVEGHTGASFSSFLKGSAADLKPLLRKTGVPNLELISGSKDSLDVADIKSGSIAKLKDSVRELEFDYVILDIGPGTSSNMLDLFLIGDEGIILTTPEPTAIENTYRFIKCLLLRRMRNIINSDENSHMKDLLKGVFINDRSRRISTVADIFARLREINTEDGKKLKEIMGKTSIRLIINQVKNAEDKYIGPSMRKACCDYFGMEVGFLGDIGYEDSVGDSIRSKKPLILSHEKSGAAADIEKCLQNIIKAGKHELRKVRA